MGRHGAAGCSAADVWPNLAGQEQGYLLKQLKDFKAGNRKDAMTAMIAALNETDMANLAAYYSSLPACKYQLESDKIIKSLYRETLFIFNLSPSF